MKRMGGTAKLVYISETVFPERGLQDLGNQAAGSHDPALFIYPNEMHDMQSPIEGMKNRPYGEPYMAGAWFGCVVAIGSQTEAQEYFLEATGHDIADVLNSRGIARLIDESTGHQRAVIVAFCDWVTEHFWGLEGQEEEALSTR